jgi:hypothetical protein
MCVWLSGCQLLSGIDELREGGANAGAAGQGGATPQGGNGGDPQGAAPPEAGAPEGGAPCVPAGTSECNGDNCLGMCMSGECNIACPTGKNCGPDEHIRCQPLESEGGVKCVFECEDNGCDDQTIVCPPDHDCVVNCTGTAACVNTIIECGSGSCEVFCTTMGCGGGLTTINCGDGPCNLTCDQSMGGVLNQKSCGETVGCPAP